MSVTSVGRVAAQVYIGGIAGEHIVGAVNIQRTGSVGNSHFVTVNANLMDSTCLVNKLCTSSIILDGIGNIFSLISPSGIGDRECATCVQATIGIVDDVNRL